MSVTRIIVGLLSVLLISNSGDLHGETEASLQFDIKNIDASFDFPDVDWGSTAYQVKEAVIAANKGWKPPKSSGNIRINNETYVTFFKSLPDRMYMLTYRFKLDRLSGIDCNTLSKGGNTEIMKKAGQRMLTHYGRPSLPSESYSFGIWHLTGKGTKAKNTNVTVVLIDEKSMFIFYSKN